MDDIDADGDLARAFMDKYQDFLHFDVGLSLIINSNAIFLKKLRLIKCMKFLFVSYSFICT